MVLVFYTRCFTVTFKNYVLYVDIDRCDWNVIFIGSSSHFEADLLISRRFFRSTKRLAHQREGIRFGHHCCPHPSPQQGMMGIAVLCARLQNLYDWQPFSSHVLLSFLRTHIGGSFKFKHKGVFFGVFFGFPLQQWLMLPSRTFRIFWFSSALNLNYWQHTWWSQNQLETVRDLSRPVREGVPKLGVSMLNAIIH